MLSYGRGLLWVSEPLGRRLPRKKRRRIDEAKNSTAMGNDERVRLVLIIHRPCGQDSDRRTASGCPAGYHDFGVFVRWGSTALCPCVCMD